MSRFMSPVIVNDARTGKPIAVMKDDPEGQYVHWCDAYAQCSAPSPAVGGEVTSGEIDQSLRAVHGDHYPSGMHPWEIEEARKDMRAALEAFLRGRGKS